MTISVCGTVCAVSKGRKRGVKEGDGSERRYRERRASMSDSC